MSSDEKTADARGTEAGTLSPEWLERAREAAVRFHIPMPEDPVTPAEAEQRLMQFEQRGGE